MRIKRKAIAAGIALALLSVGGPVVAQDSGTAALEARVAELEAMVKQFIAHPPKPPAHVAMQLKRMGSGRR